MLFFRSEEAIDSWCGLHATDRGPSCDLYQLWQLAVAWYANRLDPNSRRPQPDEIRSIMAGIGLEGQLWDPQADDF